MNNGEDSKAMKKTLHYLFTPPVEDAAMRCPVKFTIVRSEAYFTGAVHIINNYDPSSIHRLYSPEAFCREAVKILNNGFLPYNIPELWDGNTAARITKSIERFITP